MSHTLDQTTTDYIWDVAAGLPVVLQDGTNTGACPERSRRVYGLDLISATDDLGDQTYFTSDGLGSTADLTDDQGDEVDDYTYDVFGAIRSQSGSSDNYWLFTGEQSDSDEGLYYLRARYYDSASGRFLSEDPLSGWQRRPQTQNPYPYVLNRPTNLRDPYGLCGLCDWADDNIVDPVNDTVVEPVKNTASDVGEAFATGYIDIGGTYCGPPFWGIGCVTGGAQFGLHQGVHPYAGGGIGFPGGGVNLTLFPDQSISEGLTRGVQASAAYPIWGSVGPGISGEGGAGGIVQIGWKESKPTFGFDPSGYIGAGPYFGSSGFAGVCYYVFPDVSGLIP